MTAAKPGCNLLLCACRCHVALAAMVIATRLDAPDMHGTLQLCAEYAPRSCQTSHRCARYNESVVTQKDTHSYSSSLVTLCFDSVGPTPRSRVVRHVQLAVQSHAACSTDANICLNYSSTCCVMLKAHDSVEQIAGQCRSPFLLLYTSLGVAALLCMACCGARTVYYGFIFSNQKHLWSGVR